MAKPIVAIVGRPNVGKSTLFNRIIGGRVAIVEGQPGVTRDRLYGDADWNNRLFTLVDTGGLDFQENDEMIVHVRNQAQIAITEADLIIFVVDARAGVTATDQDVAKILRRSEKPVLLAANKVDQFDQLHELFDFYHLGLGDPIPVSAAQGMNTGELLDALVNHLPPGTEQELDEDIIKIAVIGRPNVGKSSLVNALLGEQRVIVSDVPGTTRDAIDTFLTRREQKYLLIDTAGIRRRSKIDLPTERYSVIRALRAIDRCDVVLMLVDAVEKLTDQDKRIAGYAHEKGRGSILLVNKWDLLEKDHRTAQQFEMDLRDGLGFMQYAPVLFISALTGQRVHRVLDLVDFVHDQQNMRVATANFNDLLRDAVMRNPAPQDKGKRLKIFYGAQSGVKPPTFLLFVNNPDLMHFSYLRYLDNTLRSAFGFEGTPIRIFMRKRTRE